MNTSYDEKDFLVCVRCATYNHAPYIVDAMNGFTMQETNFRYICTILDDASTDGEQEVIKNYLQEHFNLQDNTVARDEETDDYILTFAQHKSNHNCFFAVFYLKYNHYSIKKSKVPYIKDWQNNCKYIAICEGDDCWTNRSKLQHQVEFLEFHPDYVAVAENGVIRNLSDMSERLFNNDEEHDVNIEELIVKRRFPTASVVYLATAIQDDYNKLKYHFDTMLWCYLCTKGKFRYQKNISSVYNRGCGITETTPPCKWAILIEKWNHELMVQFSDFYDIEISKRAIYNHFLGSVLNYDKRNNCKDYCYCFISCLKAHPLHTVISIFRRLGKSIKFNFDR